MKILFVGVYDNGTGWGNAGQDYILALDAAGIEVVPRAINVTNTTGEVPKRIRTLEKGNTKGCDIVIQNILPNMMEYDGDFDRCIGLYMSETSHFHRSGWAYHLNLMDEAWVPCKQMVGAARRSNVSKPISVVPIPCDMAKYTQRYEPFPVPEINGKFVFYTIGELNRRKNLVALLKAFHLEFNQHDPVALLIKANVPGQSNAQCNQHLSTIINQVKTELKLHSDTGQYTREIIVVQNLTNTEIMRLHATCDCFVMPSFGEAWNIPAFDAMAMGKTPICTDVGGMADFLRVGDKTAGWLVPGTETPCFGMHEGTLPYLFSGDETWIDINIQQLRRAMREAYENREDKQERASLGIERTYDFTYEAVGQTILNALRTPNEAESRVVSFGPTHSLDFLGRIKNGE